MTTSQSKWVSSSSSAEDMDLVVTEGGLSNGTCEDRPGDAAPEGDLALSNDGMSEFSNSDLSLPEVCISSNSNSFEEDMNYEVQQAYRIFTGFLLDKHKGITGPFLHPIGHQEAQHGIGGVRGRGQAQLRQSMCLRRMEEKFISQEYETITEFVADFRLMLENCYRYHGVDHWISKQAQKLEIMLEQKLTLLSRTLREKTTLAVTSKGRFGAEEERVSGGTSTRRRLAPRSLATITVGGHESVMVQALRLEEQQRAKDEKRQREQEKKEAEEMSAKEVEEWEQTLLSQAFPHAVDTLWELPAIGHFLCLAQTALNLPEIVFFELERCLLMPRCSTLLSKIMSSLLSPPQRRATLHRRPTLPYCRWESELRQRVMGWYRTVGASRDQLGRVEQLGLCHQFFHTLGEVSPLEEKPFHMLPFYQRVWLLKGLCDHVYETQKDVQDALLSQPIHECRESILGYDSKENAYIHFPHFCGADLRIYCQSPSTPPSFPFPSLLVRKVEKDPETEGEESDGIKDKAVKSERGYYGGSMDTGGSNDFGNGRVETLGVFKGENGDGEQDKKRFKSWSPKEEEVSESVSTDEDSCKDSKLDLKIHTNSLSLSHTSPIGGHSVELNMKGETVELEHQSKRLTSKQEQGFSLGSVRTIKAETEEPCLSVGEHSYTGRSPARSVNQVSPTKVADLKMEGESPSQRLQRSPCLECFKSKTSAKSEEHGCCCGTSGLLMQLSSESTQNSSEERVNDKIWTKKKKRKKKRGREQLPRVKGERKQLQHVDRMRLSPVEAAKSAVRRVATTIKRKDKKKKQKTEKKLESSKKIKAETPVEPSFKLVCTSLEELRELISKTEDELDDLESAKKRLGRWYYRREAVKDLHSTLIRLLNELSPWEPKLVKAFQRNRLRLKKEFDDFKKHPHYNSFVREECISSSSDDDDDEDRGSGKELCSLSDHYRRSEEEDLEHMVPRGLWSGASTREFVTESAGERMETYVDPNHLKPPVANTEKNIGLMPRVEIGSTNITSTNESGLQSGSEQIPSNQSIKSNLAWEPRLTAETSLSHKPPILHPTTGLPKGYTPIPTLLAKSVGNKVTLMKRPADCLGVNSVDKQSKVSSVPLPTSAVTTTKLSKAQNSPSTSQENSQQMQVQGLQEMDVLRQPGMATVTAALPKSPQAKPPQAVPKSPVQVVYKVPEKLGHIVRKDSSSPVKISVHPVMDQNIGEKIMQQVVILPSNLLIHKTEEKASSSYQQQSTGIQVPVSKVASPLCMSTNVPGFSIPENRIPVQQVAPLKDARATRIPSPSISPHLQHITSGIKGVQVCCSQASTTKGVTTNPSPITTLSRAVSTESLKSTDPKQELKTVCIRDSQSILVTTRGGNTGIVKVQTSSDQNALGSLPTSPVITISPQFKAFLVSKTSQTLHPSAPCQTSPCTTPATPSISMAQSQKQISSVLKTPSAVTTPMLTAVPGSISNPNPGSQTANTSVALSQGPNTSVGSTVASKIGQLVQRAAAGSHFQASLVKNTVVVPTLTSSGVHTQGEFMSKTGVKRASTDERSQVTKFILVTPSSSASNIALSKGTPTSTKSLHSSRVMFISQPTATSSTTSVEPVPKQVIATGASGQLLTTSLSSQTVKMGLNPGQPVGGVNLEALSQVKNITLPSGFQIQLSGKTTTIGQTIGALTRSQSKSTPVSVSDTGHLTATTSEMVLVTSSNTITSSSPLQGIPSFSMISQPGSFTTKYTAATLPAENAKKDLGIPPSILSSNFPAQVTKTWQNSPVQTFTSTLAHPPSNHHSGISGETTQTPISSTTNTNTPFTTSATGTIQQRIVINTSTPLAAGTQILLNNARFVVPPQGLGPGSHVLIISSPAPQQVPTVSAPSIGASVPPPGASHVTVAPQGQVLPQSPARLPGVASVSCPFVACTPVVGPSMIATTPSVTPVQTGTLGLGSTLLPGKTNVVSALPRLPVVQAGNFASSPVGSPTVVSSLPRLGSIPAHVSPVVSSAPALSSALATIRFTAGTPTQAECSSTISPAVAPPLSRFSAPLSSLPGLPSPSAVTLPNCVIPVPAPLSSCAAPVVAGTPALHSSLPAQQVVSVTTRGPCIQPQQTAFGFAVPSTALSQALTHTGLGSTPVRKTVPAVMQPVLGGARTQILPTVAVPPIVSSVSRVQTLPIATVTPIGSTVNTFETAPVVTAPSSSSTVIITPAQPIAELLKTNSTIHPTGVPTNQPLEKHSLQTSSLGLHTNVASKLLISPDGAVLNTVQCQVNPAEMTACPKPLDALVVSLNSSTGTLHTHDSSVQPSQADRKCTN